MKTLRLSRLGITRRPAPESTDNPYLNAQRTWCDHMSRLVAARSLWQLVALCSLLIATTAVAGALHLASRSRFVPYVVQVDRAGAQHAQGPAEQVPAASRVVIQAQLQKFITLARRVTTDVALQKAAVFGVYSMLSPRDAATTKMNAFMNGDETSNPFHRSKRETVHTEIVSVLPQTDKSWQVEWVESVYDRTGEQLDQFRMRALVEVYQQPDSKRTEQALRDNPLGAYVRDYAWNRTEPREATQ